MCGIAGSIGTTDRNVIEKMLDVLPHRGPDDRGLYSYNNIILGHTRLSIVDVKKGHQPITTSDGNAGVICNGEIYNYLALRNTLSEKHTFTTDSDTEVILNLYLEKGTECVKYLDGMFAFMAFNKDNFLIARDPVGIKPLYYGQKDDTFYFSSELHAMSFSSIDEVHEFPAGFYYTPQEGFVQYYSVPKYKQYLHDENTILDKIRTTLKKSIEKRLLSDKDIHVGAFCSGGLDSSLISAFAAQNIPNLHTFAVGMKNDKTGESDDLMAARRVADHIGSEHHELIFTEEDYYDVLPDVIWKLESYDPSVVRSAVPCYFTCKLAAQYVTVVLTGEGADELFAGYHYMKRLKPEKVNIESRNIIKDLHSINLQRADRMGMLFNLELRVPFLDIELVELAAQIPPEFKIYDDKEKNERIEKWALRKAFSETGLIPDEVLWRYKVQYTQGAGCESLGERLAEKEISDNEMQRIQDENPGATIMSKEAAYYFNLFKKFHPQESILKHVGIWNGFNFEEERKSISGTFEEN